ncbi:hypothetical protein G9P44_001908 [Scheffersomyces stipitis]|nr:hypothetical protein G9P44_001908 [Scheffersomyces stipitis]
MSINPTMKYTTVPYKPSGSKVNGNNSNENGNENENESSSGNINNSSSNTKNVTAKKKRNRARGNAHGNQQYDATSSIFSDYDDLDLHEDDNSSYILFNPIKPSARAGNTESDILSLTDTSNTHDNVYYSDEDEEYSDEEEADADIERDVAVRDVIEEDDEEHDIDESHYRGNSRWQRHLDSTITRSEPIVNNNSLSNKIQSWYQSSMSEHAFVDDNIASWNLDENLMETSREVEVAVESQDPTNKLLLNQFYGDELFKYFDQDELDKFRKFNKLIDIRKFLLEKNNSAATGATPSALSQLIYKLLLLNRKNTETVIDTNMEFAGFAGMTDYVNYMSNTANIPARSVLVHPTTFSDTTGGSSLVLCGGVGFGGSASWNDI